MDRSFQLGLDARREHPRLGGRLDGDLAGELLEGPSSPQDDGDRPSPRVRSPPEASPARHRRSSSPSTCRCGPPSPLSGATSNVGSSTRHGVSAVLPISLGVPSFLLHVTPAGPLTAMDPRPSRCIRSPGSARACAHTPHTRPSSGVESQAVATTTSMQGSATAPFFHCCPPGPSDGPRRLSTSAVPGRRPFLKSAREETTFWQYRQTSSRADADRGTPSSASMEGVGRRPKAADARPKGGGAASVDRLSARRRLLKQRGL